MAYLAIVLTVLVSTYKTLGFYFWHDDFTWFYKLRLGQCQEVWPYNTICPLLKPLYDLFGYTPMPYYLVGLTLLLIAAIAFYRLTKNLLLTLIFSTAFIGAGVFLEAHSPVFVIPSLIFLLWSLVLLKSKQFFAFLLFIISLVISPARSAGNLLPFLAYLWLFVKNLSVGKKMTFSVGAAVMFLLIFARASTGVRQEISPAKIVSTVQMLGPILLIPALLAGIILKTKDKSLRKNLIFALVWVASMYFPYWLRTSFKLPVSHRYLFLVFPGILLAWGSFAKYKWWKFVSLVILLFGVVQSNIFLGKHSVISRQRADFYKQLHRELPSLPSGSYIFFDSPQTITNEMADFFRVGQYPPEAALGTEYAVDYDSFKLVDGQKLTQFIKSGGVKADDVLAFYYDGSTLTVGIALPTQKTFLARATLTDFSLPTGPVLEDLTDYLSFASLNRDLKKRANRISFSDSWEETVGESIFDGDFDTYWSANRQMWWAEKNKPVIEITFAQPQSISGIVIYSNSADHLPDEIEGFDVKEINQGLTAVVYTFAEKISRNLRITIASTVGGDMPVIKELEVIPGEFGDFDLTKAWRVIENPVANIQTETDKKVLSDYLRKGAPACLIWKQEGYGSGQEDFFLRVDGQVHEYNIWLPAMGVGEPKFTIGCLNYPVDVELLSFRQ